GVIGLRAGGVDRVHRVDRRLRRTRDRLDATALIAAVARRRVVIVALLAARADAVTAQRGRGIGPDRAVAAAVVAVAAAVRTIGGGGVPTPATEHEHERNPPHAQIVQPVDPALRLERRDRTA